MEVEVYIKGNNVIIIAQINLADLTKLENMPEKGLLQFFVNNDDCYGYNGPCKVQYIEEYITDERKLIWRNPYEEDYSYE